MPKPYLDHGAWSPAQLPDPGPGWIHCPRCSGDGADADWGGWFECQRCMGKGYVPGAMGESEISVEPDGASALWSQYAGVAQLAERPSCKGEVESSSLSVSSKRSGVVQWQNASLVSKKRWFDSTRRIQQVLGRLRDFGRQMS